MFGREPYLVRYIFVSSLIVSLGMLLGRLMGFVREVSVASMFGISAEADVAVLALTVPDILVSLLVAGGLSAALIPEFKKLSQLEAGMLFVQASLMVAVVTILVVFILSLEPVVAVITILFAPGMSQEMVLAAQGILSGVFWLIPLTVLAGVSTAYLQAQERFLMPALGTLIFNATIVVGLLFFIQQSGSLSLLVYFIVLGGVLRWGSQLWLVAGSIAWSKSFSKCLLHKNLFHRYWQAVLALGLLALFPVVARSFASFSGEGGVAMMNYAWRLVELPLGLVVTVLSVVLFPKLAEMVANKDHQGFEKVFSGGLRLSLMLAMIIVGSVLASPEVFVSMVFGWGGAIHEAELIKISQLFQIGIIILPIQAVIAMSIAALNAKGETLISTVISAGVFGILIALLWYIEPIYGMHGVLMTVVFAYALVAGLLLLVLSRQKVKFFFYMNIVFSLFVGATSYGLSYGVLLFQIGGVVDLVLLLFVMCVTTALFFIKGNYIRL